MNMIILGTSGIADKIMKKSGCPVLIAGTPRKYLKVCRQGVSGRRGDSISD